MNEIKILYVDDEFLNLFIFECQFKKEFRVFTASNKDDCLKILENNLIDFIITDHRMPETTGVELLSIIKNKFPKIKRIILSAFIDDIQIKDGIKNGIVEKAFEKPFEKKYITDIINNK